MQESDETLNLEGCVVHVNTFYGGAYLFGVVRGWPPPHAPPADEVVQMLCYMVLNFDSHHIDTHHHHRYQAAGSKANYFIPVIDT